MTRSWRAFAFFGTAAVCAACAACVVKLGALGADEWHTTIGWTVVAIVLALAAFGAFFNSDTAAKFAFIGSFFALCVAIGYIVAIECDLFVYFEDPDSFLELIRKYDSYAVLIYLAVQFAQVTVLPLPATLTTIAGIAVFGVTKTVLYSSAAIIAGSMVAFALGRTFGVKLAVWLCGARSVAKYRNLLKGKDTVLLYAMFLLPFFPDDLLCIIAGLGTMSYRSFLVMMIVTRPIGMLWIAGVYKGAVSIPANAVGAAVWIAIAVVTIAIFAVLYKYGDALGNAANRAIQKLSDKKKHKSASPVRKAPLRDDQLKEEIVRADAHGRQLVTDRAPKYPRDGQ